MPCASRLYLASRSSEGPVLPLKTLTKGFEVTFTEFGIIWIFVGVGQGYGDEPSLEGPEGASVDASQTEQEVPAACPGEAPSCLWYLCVTLRRTELILCNGILEGECRYRSPGGGCVSNPLMSRLEKVNL